MQLSYNKEQIEEVLKLLNMIEVKGIMGCNNVVQIYNILQNPTKEDNAKKDATKKI